MGYFKYTFKKRSKQLSNFYFKFSLNLKQSKIKKNQLKKPKKPFENAKQFK